MRIIRLFLPLLLILSYGSSQTVTTGAPLTFPEIGLLYTPPTGLRDTTGVDKRAVLERAAAQHTTNMFEILLSLQSATEDTSQNWERIGIQTYPRKKLSGLSDAEAMQRISRWVAGSGSESAEPKPASIGGFLFLVSPLQLQEAGLVRRGKIYVTVSRGRIVILSFTANSDDVLNTITTSVNTIQSLLKK